MPGERTARRIVVSGRVHGVGFRAFVTANARALGLDGFVRNRTDGTVEAMALGDAQKLDTLIEACRQGPPAARVDSVIAEPAEMNADQGFRQLPTA